MQKGMLDEWERNFRAAARADRYVLFRDNLERLEMSYKPKAMLEGTICVVRMCVAYTCVDGYSSYISRFLKMQKYNPAEAIHGRHVFTFDLSGKASAQIVVEANNMGLDLADLYASPWYTYKTAGFTELWMSRTDCRPLTAREVKKFEKIVTQDMRRSFGEDELSFWFDDSRDESFHFASFQEPLDE